MILDKFGAVVLGYQYYPSYYFFAKQPLRTAEDIEGMRIRASGIMLLDLLDGMGADAADLAFDNVHTSLETGAIDAAVSCGACGSTLNWDEVSSYLVGPIVGLPHSWITISQKIWNDLSPDLRIIIRVEVKRHEELTKTHALKSWNLVEETERTGMTHIEMSPDLRRLAREAAFSTVLPNWITRSGGRNSEAAKIYNDKVVPILNHAATSQGFTK